jgi:hypothetical protein
MGYGAGMALSGLFQSLGGSSVGALARRPVSAEPRPGRPQARTAKFYTKDEFFLLTLYEMIRRTSLQVSHLAKKSYKQTIKK